MDDNDLLGILVPAIRKGGYKIDMRDPVLTDEIRSRILKCTESYISTEEKKSIRYRFLSYGKLSQDLRNKLSLKLAETSNSYEKWLDGALRLKTETFQVIAQELFSSLKNIVASK